MQLLGRLHYTSSDQGKKLFVVGYSSLYNPETEVWTNIEKAWNTFGTQYHYCPKQI